MKSFSVIIFLWLCYSVRTETSCDEEGCTYSFPIPVNITTLNTTEENEVLTYIQDTIDALKTNLSNAYDLFSEVSDDTISNLTSINTTITNLNNMIDNLTQQFTNTLQPSINDLSNQITRLDDVMYCFGNCSTSTINLPTTTTTKISTKAPITTITTTAATTTLRAATTVAGTATTQIRAATTTTGAVVTTTEAPTTTSMAATTETTGTTITTTAEIVCQVDSDDCQNNGTCVGTGQCHCTPSWTGPLCNTSICDSDTSPCKFGSTCIATDPYSCMCYNSTYFGQDCSEYNQTLITINQTSGDISSPTSGDPKNPYTYVIASWTLQPNGSSYYYTINVTSTLMSAGDYLVFTDSSLPAPSTLVNFNTTGTNNSLFNSSVGGTVGISFHGSENSQFSMTYTEDSFNPCDTHPDCGDGTCIASISDPTAYSCMCPSCFSGDRCQTDNTNYAGCTLIPGFCDTIGGCCAWPCTTSPPTCNEDNCQSQSPTSTMYKSTSSATTIEGGH